MTEAMDFTLGKDVSGKENERDISELQLIGCMTRVTWLKWGCVVARHGVLQILIFDPWWPCFLQ